MAKKNFEKLKAELEKKGVAEIYLFLGPQMEPKREAVKLLSSLLLPPGSETFNLDQREAEGLNLSTFQNLTATVPWGAPKRVVVLWGVDRLLDKALSTLAEIVSKTPVSTCLILEAEKLAESNKLYKAVSEKGEVIEFSAMREDKVIRWIIDRAKALGKEVEPEAAGALYSVAGNDLERLSRELEKLSAFCGEKQRITQKDVEIHLESTPEYQVYQLVGFICAGDAKSALSLTQELLKAHKFGYLLFNQLQKDFFCLWKVFSFSESRSNDAALASHLGLAGRTYLVNKYINCAKNLTKEKTEEAIAKISEAEIALRYSPSAPETLIEVLVLELCRLAAAKADYARARA